MRNGFLREKKLFCSFSFPIFVAACVWLVEALVVILLLGMCIAALNSRPFDWRFFPK